jgi:hypothetical protein
MRAELWKHKFAYLSLLLALGGFALLYMAVWPNTLWQRCVALGACVFYFCWGVITHTKTNTVTTQVIKEYAGISVLAAVMLWLVAS